MKFDFYTGAIDSTNRGSDFGYGKGLDFNNEFYFSFESLSAGAQGVANGECDKFFSSFNKIF